MKHLSITLFITFMVLACSADTSSYCVKQDTLLLSIAETDNNIIVLLTTTDTLTQQTQKAVSLTPEQKKKKLLASFLSFPFPLGFLGTHRIMMGTKPWVPVVYVATFGGCFGLLPLVDFCVILLSDDIEQYENNPNVFMWIK